MTRARAPGKIVLSGAYAVLAGAPAIVSAVSRYVTADTERPATFVTEEVQAALLPGEQAPWFDASELREGERKLGLGSSAAILVASLFALEQARAVGHSRVQQLHVVMGRALVAHKKAQGGGSGVDVAASTLGGTFVYRLGPTGAATRPVKLPADLHVEVWTCPTSASTRELLAAVARLAEVAPQLHARWLGAQILASHQAALSVERRDTVALIAALRAQQRALSGLGGAAAVPIVTPELSALAAQAEDEDGVLLPAGAGGGDIALFVGREPATLALRAALENQAHQRLELELSAPGVAALPEPGGEPADEPAR
jgi:phosphomevalonate kinase